MSDSRVRSGDDAEPLPPRAFDSVQLVLFEIDGKRFAADLSQVARVDFFEAAQSVGAPLGPCRTGERSLVIRVGDDREPRLAIDAMLGVRKVALEDLRRLPPVAAHGKYAMGAWLDGQEAVLLVDLHAMIDS